MGKITEIGCSWVTTTMPLASPGGDVVALVDLAQADAAGDRRDDVGVAEIELAVLTWRLVGDHRAFVLPHERPLGVELLLGDRVLRQNLLVALQVEPGIRQQRLVALQIALGLLERGLVGTRVDLGQEIARLHQLAFLEGDLVSWPLIWVLTVTVASGVTVPSAGN